MWTPEQLCVAVYAEAQAALNPKYEREQIRNEANFWLQWDEDEQRITSMG